MDYNTWVIYASLICSYFFSLCTIIAISYSLVRIKRWITQELAEPFGRKWLCRQDGLFVIYLVLACLIFMVDIAIGVVGKRIAEG